MQMSKQMLTLKLDPQRATVNEVRKRLDLRPDEIDADFGVNCIDPKQNLYAVLVEDSAAELASKKEGVAGPFANPKIEPFGLES